VADFKPVPAAPGTSNRRHALIGAIGVGLVALIAAGALFLLGDSDEKQDEGTDGTDTGSGAPAPSNRDLIAFRSDRDGDDEIFVMNAAGSGIKNLTNSAGADSDPSWSPDGKKIAFQSNRDGDWDIYVMNADGSQVRNLTNNTAADTDPVWAPDNRLIAFSSDREGNPDIFVMTPGGVGVADLTPSPASEEDPTWSPDSKRIAFQSDVLGGEDIIQMQADGTNPRNLTQGNSGPDEDPDFSPTDNVIALSRLDDVFVLDVATRDLTQVSSGTSRESDPAFSDNGAELVFQSDRDGDEDLYLAPAGGGKARNLTRNDAFDADPDWLP
jgi:Tol biopolymer transport system component